MGYLQDLKIVTIPATTVTWPIPSNGQLFKKVQNRAQFFLQGIQPRNGLLKKFGLRPRAVALRCARGFHRPALILEKLPRTFNREPLVI